MMLKTKKVKAEVFIMKNSNCAILGLQTERQLGLIGGSGAKVDAVNSTYRGLTLEDVKKKYSPVFDDSQLGKYSGKYRIKLTEGVQPNINPPRRMPHKLMKPLKETLDEMQEKDVIEPVKHPTDWVNSMVCTEKKNGKLLSCLDPRELKKYIMRGHYMIPTFQEVIARLGRPKYFTIIDQSWAFWQVELDDDSKDLTTFQTPYGRYRFNRMPFGISSASEVMQKKGYQMFGNIPGVHIIADDLLIAGDTEEEHDSVTKVPERAAENNIKFSLPKLQFKKPQVVYHPDPTDKQGVQQFLGMVNYLSPFIPNRAELTEPLRQLVTDGVPFTWGRAQKEATNRIRAVLSSQVILRYYVENKPLTIQADASQDGL